MNNLNSILIEGNLVREPMLRSTPKGTQICTMRLATNRYYKLDKQASGYEREVSYFEVETWAKLAEACYSKARKGRGLRVVGRLKQNRWNDSDGKHRYKITIVAEHVEFRPESKKKEEKLAFEESTDDSEDSYRGDYSNHVRKGNVSGKALESVIF